MAPSHHASATTVDPSHSCDCKKGFAPSPSPVARNTAAGIDLGSKIFRVSTMDCPVEEAEIRRASLEFAMPAVLEAIRHAGFNPEPVTAPAANEHGHSHARMVTPTNCRFGILRARSVSTTGCTVRRRPS